MSQIARWGGIIGVGLLLALGAVGCGQETHMQELYNHVLQTYTSSNPDRLYYVGSDNAYDYGNNLHFSDITGSWGAGQGCDTVGLKLSYSNTKIAVRFGHNLPSSGQLNPGDSYTVTVLGATYSGTA